METKHSREGPSNDIAVVTEQLDIRFSLKTYWVEFKELIV